MLIIDAKKLYNVQTMSKQDLHILSWSRKLRFKEISNAEGLEMRCNYGVLGTVRREL